MERSSTHDNLQVKPFNLQPNPLNIQVNPALSVNCFFHTSDDQNRNGAPFQLWLGWSYFFKLKI
jgi:hypothetical protein